jgi:hypothetical protein
MTNRRSKEFLFNLKVYKNGGGVEYESVALPISMLEDCVVIIKKKFGGQDD